MGTFTAQLGDPSGHDKLRPVLSEEETKANAGTILKQVGRILKPGFDVHFNHVFTDEMSIPFFLTEIASKFTAQFLLSRDGFRKRTEAGLSISMHELLVPLFQAWDSVKLKSRIEIGGTDQLFNFNVTRKLQEMFGVEPEVCIMTPIINGTDGRKMSKSFDNVIWLDEEPEQMFALVMSTPDAVTDEWFCLLSDLEAVEDPFLRKKQLAFDVVLQLHSLEAAQEAQEAFESKVQKREVPGDILETEAKTILEMVVEARSISKSAARKIIEGGGVQIDGQKVFDLNRVGFGIVKIGKRQFIKGI